MRTHSEWPADHLDEEDQSGGGWRSGAMHQWIPVKGSPPLPGQLPDQEVAQGSNMAKGEK